MDFMRDECISENILGIHNNMITDIYGSTLQHYEYRAYTKYIPDFQYSQI